MTTRKSSIAPQDGKKSKRKGKKVRIAPIDSDTVEEQLHHSSSNNTQELEMTPLTHTEPSIGGGIHSLSSSAESKSTEQNGNYSSSCNEAKSEEGVADNESILESRDTESLLPSGAVDSSSSGGSALGAAGTKKAVLADTLRFLFLGLPGYVFTVQYLSILLPY